MGSRVDEVLEFWFGELNDKGLAADEAVKRWFVKSDEFDRELEVRFDGLRKEVMAGHHEDWLEEPDSLVAYVVVLDQFSRNICRGTAEMYAADERALKATHFALDQRYEGEMGIDHRVAIYMPLMHSEELAEQELCVKKFEALQAKHPSIERLGKNVEYAIKHRDIVAEWGRFPHRNEILGRDTTAEEAEFLKTPGSSF